MNLENKTADWRFLSLDVNSAPWNMAVDHAVFDNISERIKSGVNVSPILRLYQFSQPAVILGYQQKLNGIDLQMLRSVSGDYTTRLTGGGHVYFTPSELHFSIVCPNSILPSDLPQSYKENNIKIAEALRSLGVNAEAGRTSVKVNGKTLVVSAQAKSKYATLHHGTILADIDFDFFGKILGASEDERKLIKEVTCLAHLQRDYRSKINNLCSEIVKNVTGGKYKTDKLDEDEVSYAKRYYNEIYRNKRFIRSGEKEAGVCIVAGLLMDYEDYIAQNTHSIHSKNGN